MQLHANYRTTISLQPFTHEAQQRSHDDHVDDGTDAINLKRLHALIAEAIESQASRGPDAKHDAQSAAENSMLAKILDRSK